MALGVEAKDLGEHPKIKGKRNKIKIKSDDQLPWGKKDKQNPTKGRWRRSAQTNRGENPQDRDTKDKEEDAFKDKEASRIVTADPAEATLLPYFVGITGCLALFLGQFPLSQNPLNFFSYHSKSIFQILLLKCPWMLISSPTSLP